MPASIFNLRVPLANDDVFLMNTLTDAQVIISADAAALLDGAVNVSALDHEAREAFDLLVDNGFITPGREYDRQSLNNYLHQVTNDTSELNITVLTTLQCNFACDYCFQGDHGDYNKFADKMSMETAVRVADWIERELDSVRPEKLVLTFFGGEPLLNLPVMYYLAERLWQATAERGVQQLVSIITNGLLLTEDIVDRMLPYGFKGVKITLDGDRDTHNRMRPLRGGQGTFDRIVENMRKIAGKCKIAIGGNFDASSVESFPALLEFLKELEFSDRFAKVAFKPVVRSAEDAGAVAKSKPALKGILPLIPVSANGAPLKPLGGTCMTSAGAGTASTCDSCHTLDDQMTFLRDEVAARRLQHAGRRPQRTLSRSHQARPHARARWIALRVSRVHRREGHVHRSHRRPARSLARARAGTVRSAQSMERMRRLRLHPRVCRGLHCSIARDPW